MRMSVLSDPSKTDDYERRMTMKRKLLKSAVLFAAIAVSLSGCSFTNVVSQNLEGSKPTAQESSRTEISTVPELSLEETEGRQYMRKAVEVAEKPEITALTLSAECSGDISKICRVQPSYPGHVFVSNTVGLIGPPIEVSNSASLTNATLMLEYDENELRGVPEKNISVMFYPYSDDDSGVASGLGFGGIQYDSVTDEENNKVTIDLKGDGYYILLDIYEYGTAMGMNVSEYAYEKDQTAYLSDWEREGNIGDIMKIADKQWAVDNAPNFHVSTPEQLASVVYYANAIADGSDEVNIYLEDDIDLIEYKWAPMGWKSFTYIQVSIFGQGHTISNLNINFPREPQIGITGYVGDFTASDLTIENAFVSGNRYTGLFCGECHGDKYFTNVTASGNVFGGGVDVGSFVGAGSKGNYRNCVNNVKVNGEDFPYYCAEDKYNAENSDETAYTLTIDAQGNISRTANGEEYENLTWVILNENGGNVLSRNATNETTFPKDILYNIGAARGETYTMHLEGWGGSGYITISNTIEFTLD